MDKDEIEELKQKLYEAIDLHGRDSFIVLEISRELDKHIAIEAKNYEDNNRCY